MDEEPARGPGARALVSGTALLFAARLLAAGLALLQAILLASTFGTSATTDAYFVASAVALLFTTPIDTALNLAFQPVFVHAVETDGEAAAWRIGAGVFRAGLAATGLISLAIVGLAAWICTIMAPGFDAAATAQAAQLVRITAPCVFLAYAASFLSSLEFIEGRSFLPSVGMVVSAAGGPLALVWLADRYGVISLAWGMLGSAALRCLLLMRPSHLRRLRGPALRIRDPVMRRLGAMMAARLATTLFLELNLLVDRIFASLLGPGFISALAYASRAVMTLVRLFIMPMGRMIMPWLSRLAAREQYDRLRGVVEKLVIGAAFVLVPLVAFIVAFRTELLGLVFGRGAFDAAAIQATSVAVLFYALGIIPFLVVPMLSAVFFALQDTATPLRIGMVCVVANAVLDALLIVALGHGGIALATSLVAAVRAALLWVYLRRRIGALHSQSVLGSLLVSAATAMVAFWSARLVLSLAGPGWSGPVWRLAASALVGGAGYLVLQNLFNRPVARLLPAVLGRLAAARS
jgi:putative peptidoglycan lipid II flippase